jgi:hypothetical protein
MFVLHSTTQGSSSSSSRQLQDLQQFLLHLATRNFLNVMTMEVMLGSVGLWTAP